MFLDWISMGMLATGVVSAWAAWSSASAAKRAESRANEIYNSEKLLAQRQFIVPLWQQTSTLANIDSNNPKTEDVIRAANVLELVAVCTEGEMVDRQVMKRVFAENFLRLYRQISKCKNIPGLGKDGDDVLNEIPAVKLLFKNLEEEADSKHKLSGL
jgi:hypothetical protein